MVEAPPNAERPRYHRLPFSRLLRSHNRIHHAEQGGLVGLVINEALESGLAVLVSTGSGTAPDLVAQGTNYVTFTSFHADELVQQLVAPSDAPASHFAEKGAATRTIIEANATQRFVPFATSLVETLRAHLVQNLTLVHRALLAAFCTTLGRL